MEALEYFKEMGAVGGKKGGKKGGKRRKQTTTHAQRVAWGRKGGKIAGRGRPKEVAGKRGTPTSAKPRSGSGIDKP